MNVNIEYLIIYAKQNRIALALTLKYPISVKIGQ
jgi:hypothetical protein